MMLEKELETAIAVAREAAVSVNEFYAREIISEEKTGIDNFSEPVTEADREASRIIVRGLGKEFPHDAILSEEETDDIKRRMRKQRVWMVDPIDGTAGFVKKDGDFAVQVGLSIAGEPVLGVVLLPFHDVLYYAAKGRGSWAVSRGGTPEKLRVSQKTEISDMIMAVSRNHPSRGIRTIIDEFKTPVRARGSVGLKIGTIVERECDLYINLSNRTKFWDTCGPQAILEEAGGKMTDLFGREFRYDIADIQNHNGIVSTNGISHSNIIDSLRPILSRVGRMKLSARSGK